MPAQLTAIVTGAAGGIGSATALALARDGRSLLLTSRDEARLNHTLTQVRREFPSVTCVAHPANLTEPDAAAAVVSRALRELGRLDALINIAGLAPLQPIEAVTPDLWRRCVDANLSAVIYLTVAAWPTFRRQGSGIVVNVSSMSSIDPFRGFNIYAAAKAGLNMFTHCTAQEGADFGLRAVAVAPGAVETPMLRQHFDESVLPRSGALSPTAVATVIADCVSGRRPFRGGEVIELVAP